MRLIIFGATGATGQQLVQQALAQGHQVRAFVRDPAKVELRHDNLEVVQGDMLDPVTVDRALAGGADAVVLASDLDEIPSLDFLYALKHCEPLPGVLDKLPLNLQCRLTIFLKNKGHE